MLFHIFNSQETRRKYGGSAFIEMQFCKLPAGTKMEDIIAVDRINHWQNDSLYIDDKNIFYLEYKRIFNCGIYNNLKSGVVDVYGINYYAPEFVYPIIKKLHKERPVDYEVLVDWLNNAKEYNGFYILGI